MHTVTFTKAYVSGHLAGLRLVHTQKFDRRADAIKFYKGNNELFATGNGGCDYLRVNSKLMEVVK